MANESVSVSGPIEVKSDATARVAFDLMKHIANEESEVPFKTKEGRDYWLTLYLQCHRVARGFEPE